MADELDARERRQGASLTARPPAPRPRAAADEAEAWERRRDASPLAAAAPRPRAAADEAEARERRRDASPPARPPAPRPRQLRMDADSDGPNDEAALLQEAFREADQVSNQDRVRPAAAGHTPSVGSRHSWTQLEDFFLLLGVRDVGVGNWPRVLHTIHAHWHQLTWAKVWLASFLFIYTKVLLINCATGSGSPA